MYKPACVCVCMRVYYAPNLGASNVCVYVPKLLGKEGLNPPSSDSEAAAPPSIGKKIFPTEKLKNDNKNKKCIFTPLRFLTYCILFYIVGGYFNTCEKPYAHLK